MTHAWFGGPDEPGPGKENERSGPALLASPEQAHSKTLLRRDKSCLKLLNQPPHVVPARSRAEREHMKGNHLAKCVVLGLAVLLATSAFASNQGSLYVAQAVEVNGQTIPASGYKLTWEGTGPNVEVSFTQGKKVVTKTSAKVIELKQAPADNATIVGSSNGKTSITEVRFGGKKYALSLGGAEKAEMSGAPNR